MNDKCVTYLVKDYTNKGSWKEVTITGVEFTRRFLMHVPPHRFVRVRHYGLLCNRVKKEKMARCRSIFQCKQYLSSMREMNTNQVLKHLYGVDIQRCRDCGGHMQKAKPEHLFVIPPPRRLLS